MQVLVGKNTIKYWMNIKQGNAQFIMNQPIKVKLISTCTDYRHPGYLKFKESLDTFKWDYEFLNAQYVAYGSKMVAAYEYTKKTDCTHLFIVDAYDIFMLGTMQEALDKIPDKDCILFNAEKASWPYGEWAKEYPEVEGQWKYLNGGACFVQVEKFIRLFEENPIRHTDNDQPALARVYLDKRDQYNMKLDTNCDLFQSIAFEHDGDFLIQDGNVRFINLEMGTSPIIIHGNGKTPMDKIYKLL